MQRSIIPAHQFCAHACYSHCMGSALAHCSLDPWRLGSRLRPNMILNLVPHQNAAGVSCSMHTHDHTRIHPPLSFANMFWVGVTDLRCREADVDLHAYPSRKDLATAVSTKRKRAVSKADAKRKLRQKILAEFFVAGDPLSAPPPDRVAAENAKSSAALKKFRRLPNWDGH